MSKIHRMVGITHSCGHRVEYEARHSDPDLSSFLTNCHRMAARPCEDCREEQAAARTLQLSRMVGANTYDGFSLPN